MSDRIFKKVTVVGAGQMGAGIAQVCATAEIPVLLVDLSDIQLSKAQKVIQQSLGKLAEKGKISPQNAELAGSLITYQQSYQGVESSDLLIEAVSENETIKKDIFSTCDKILPPDGIIATNTSSLPITRLAAVTGRADRFIGMHFMNPVPLMKLVEVISGAATSKETTEKIIQFSHLLGKETSSSKDYPGFVVNRILMPMINEAFSALMEGVASAEDIDKGMRLGTNQPMGPLTLADFIGLDTCLAIMRVLHDGFGDPRYRPSPLLVQYVDAGWYGRKTKRGVYSYE
jgi:3-hydroxybutyryl-CoA dehydrogenase